MDDETVMCSHVTGSSALSVSPRGRRIGNRRADGRWDVLCDMRAGWTVDGAPACDRDVVAIARAQAQGERILALTPIP